MNVEDFKNISIRGRVAYGIACLERALLVYHCQNSMWNSVLEKLWSYTSVKYLDDWYYEIAEYLPDSISETTEYISSEFEFLSEEQFNDLKILYGESNIIIEKLFRLIFEMGTIDIYGKLEKHSMNTLDKLGEILKIMNIANIELPEIQFFLKYRYEDNNGWGECIDGKEYSLFLKR